jgi:ubiquinone/menaquinone biosynthesis C-methylase UbiE
MKAQPVHDRIRKLIQWTPRCRRLLDLGCDSGDVTARLVDKAEETYGVDNNPEAIAAAKRKHKGVKFVLAKGERLPFKDDFFDAVVMGEVLEHVEDERKTLNEVYRVLKPGGTLILSVPHKGLFGFIDSFNLKFHFPRLYRLWKGKNYSPEIYKIQPWHRHYSLRDLTRLFGKRFAIRKTHRGGLIAYPLLWVAEDMFHLQQRLGFLAGPLNIMKHLEYQIDFKNAGYAVIINAVSTKRGHES